MILFHSETHEWVESQSAPGLHRVSLGSMQANIPKQLGDLTWRCHCNPSNSNKAPEALEKWIQASSSREWRTSVKKTIHYLNSYIVFSSLFYLPTPCRPIPFHPDPPTILPSLRNEIRIRRLRPPESGDRVVRSACELPSFVSSTSTYSLLKLLQQHRSLLRATMASDSAAAGIRMHPRPYVALVSPPHCRTLIRAVFETPCP